MIGYLPNSNGENSQESKLVSSHKNNLANVFNYMPSTEEAKEIIKELGKEFVSLPEEQRTSIIDKLIKKSDPTKI